MKKVQERIQQSMRPVEDPSPSVHDIAVDSSEQPGTTKKTSFWDRLDKKIAGHLNKTPVGYIKILLEGEGLDWGIQTENK